ncbi:MAG: zf-HC2 domain-containing protein [Gammaproteobacteria bacterium]
MLKCRDMVNQTDQYLADDLTPGQRFAMKTHLLMCRHCRRFVRQFKLLLDFLPSLSRPADEQTVDKIMHGIERERLDKDNK